MRNESEDYKLLASLAVFRELYDAEKDVYGIISVFINDLIKSNSLYFFTLEEITNKLNSTFEFDIPDAVVKTSLGRLKYIAKADKIYSVVDISKVNATEIDEKKKIVISNNDNIIHELYNFIEEKQNLKLSQTDKEKVTHSFCCFLVDESNGDQYIEFITAFILQNESKSIFKNQLNLIREGVILYSGIKYNNNLNDIGAWKTELTIFIDTEILFHLAGFNGVLFQNLAEDFMSYVKEINSKAKRSLIQLRYFDEVKDEIEAFFTKAKYILDGKERLIPKGTAMISILNGCKKQSDIQQKRSDFYYLLKSEKIELDDYEGYYDLDNHKYNIESQVLIKKVSEELHVDPSSYFRFLNYVSIRRKEANSNNFENISCILLSGNSMMLKIAWNDSLKLSGDVPLATSLSFLTNKFWFKLNKGFGKTSLPKSFDVITKAQIILSKILNDSVSEKYSELQKEFRNGTLNEDLAKSRLLDLRSQVRRPEEIKNDVINDVLFSITEDDLARFKREGEHFRVKAKSHEDENVKLIDQLKQKSERELQIQIDMNKSILSEKKNLEDILTTQHLVIQTRAENRYKNFKLKIAAVIIIYVAAIPLLIYRFKWDSVEPYTYFFSIFGLVIPVLWWLIFEDEINPITYMKGKKLQFLEEEFYIDKFDRAQLPLIRESIKKISNETELLIKEKES